MRIQFSIYGDMQNSCIIKIFYKMQASLCTKLIEFDSIILDLELEQKVPDITPLPSSKEEPTYFYEEQPISTDALQSQLLKHQTQYQVVLPPNIALQPIRVEKKKKIKKDIKSKPQPEDSDFSNSQGTVRSRKNKDLKNSQYPTKNFLPNFKGPHLQYLERYFGSGINSHNLIQYLRNKDGISLQDYERLYRTSEFSVAFKSMFECKFLYRQLLLSRSDPYTKKIHQRKVHVFEEAFKTKSFTRINY